MTAAPPAPVSPAKTIKRPNPSRFQAPAPAPVVAPPVPVAAPVAAPSVPPTVVDIAARAARAAAERVLEDRRGRYQAAAARAQRSSPSPPRSRSRSRGRRRGGHSRRRRSPSSSRSRSSSSSSASSSSSGRRRSRSRSPRRNRYDTALPQAPPAANHYGPAPHRYAVPAPLRLCKHWLASGGTYCPYGARCNFAHGEDQVLRHHAPHPPPYTGSHHGKPPARTRDRSPSPASGLGPRPKRRHLVAAPAPAPAPAPAEDDFDELYSEVAAPAPAPAAAAEDEDFTVKLGMKTAPAAADDDDDDACYDVSLGMRASAAAAEPSSPDDESEPSPAAPQAAPAPGPATAEASPPAWEQSARELLAAVRGKGLLEIRSALTKHGFKIGDKVYGGSYFCFEAPGHYPCTYDVIGKQYKGSKTSSANCSFRMRSHPQLIKYLEGALARGASLRLESAWDTGLRSRSRSPAQLEPTAAPPSSPPRTPPPKRAPTAVPATVYEWCEAKKWGPTTARYRDIVMCCDDLDALADFWDHPDREEVLADWPGLARSILRRGIKELQAARAK